MLGTREDRRDAPLINRLWYMAKPKTKVSAIRAPTGVYHKNAQTKKKAAG